MAACRRAIIRFFQSSAVSARAGRGQRERRFSVGGPGDAASSSGSRNLGVLRRRLFERGIRAQHPHVVQREDQQRPRQRAHEFGDRRRQRQADQRSRARDETGSACGVNRSSSANTSRTVVTAASAGIAGTIVQAIATMADTTTRIVVARPAAAVCARLVRERHADQVQLDRVTTIQSPIQKCPIRRTLRGVAGRRRTRCRGAPRFRSEQLVVEKLPTRHRSGEQDECPRD